MRPYHRPAAATLGAATLIGLLLAAPAVATGDGGPCDQALVNDLSDVRLESRPAGETPGEATLTAAGLRVKTPAASSKVSASFPVNVRPKRVDGLEFRSVAHGSTVVVPSYQLGVDFDGDGKPDAVGAWEAGQNEPQAGPDYDAYQAGAAKYRFTGDLPKAAAGAAAAKNPVLTFAEFAEAWPDARIVYFGLNQGRGDAGGDTTWTSVKLKAGKECAAYRWRKPVVETNESAPASATPTPTPEPSTSPAESASPTASPSVSVSPSESVSPSPSTGVVTASPAPEGGGGSSLPVTGVKLAGLVAGSTALLGVGIALVLLARRRRVG
jgi:hypothetical protein